MGNKLLHRADAFLSETNAYKDDGARFLGDVDALGKDVISDTAGLYPLLTNALVKCKIALIQKSTDLITILDKKSLLALLANTDLGTFTLQSDNHYIAITPTRAPTVTVSFLDIKLADVIFVEQQFKYSVDGQQPQNGLLRLSLAIGISGTSITVRLAAAPRLNSASGGGSAMLSLIPIDHRKDFRARLSDNLNTRLNAHPVAISTPPIGGSSVAYSPYIGAYTGDLVLADAHLHRQRTIIPFHNPYEPYHVSFWS